jgi:vacuolar protein sorting-associated protein VTA1
VFPLCSQGTNQKTALSSFCSKKGFLGNQIQPDTHTQLKSTKSSTTMPPMNIPPELKKLTPFVRRAEELDKDTSSPVSRLVSFYCRQYAVHTGIPLATSPPGKACLGELLSHLEKEKAAMDNFTREEAKFLCRQFADKIFDRADGEDRAGEASKDTAKTFYAAASFMEILQQFYSDEDTSEDREEEKKKLVYAKWKATEILKAIKAGRTPTPGGYGEENTAGPPPEEAEDATTAAAATDDSFLPAAPTSMINKKMEPTAPVIHTVSHEDDDEPEITIRMPEPEEEEEPPEAGTEVEFGGPPPYPSGEFGDVIPYPPPVIAARPPVTFAPPPPMPAVPSAKLPDPVPKKAPAPIPAASGGFFGMGKKKTVSKAEFSDAMELARFALAALEEKNADVAAERLKQALHVLGR